MFAKLRGGGEGAFVPFTMLGYPSPAATLNIVDALIAGGADALELGIPFSDPVADGPAIQAAAAAAIEQGATLERCFELIVEIRQRHSEIPIGILVYSNLVVRAPEKFYAAAALAGVDSILIADVPGAELEPFVAWANQVQIDPILIVPPNADSRCIDRVARWGRGYTYLLGRSGVTGTQTSMQRPAADLIQALENAAAPPALLGFGISTPEHVRSALNAGARGAIAGSAIVQRIAEHQEDASAQHRVISQFVAAMKAATRRAQ